MLPMQERDTLEKGRKPSVASLVMLVLLVAVSIYTYPRRFLSIENQTADVRHVFYWGWLTALSTGYGTLPFLCVTRPSSTVLGLANAAAAGMMGSASVGLVVQWIRCEVASSVARTLVGIVVGVLFIRLAKTCLENHEEVLALEATKYDARKVLLVMLSWPCTRFPRA